MRGYKEASIGGCLSSSLFIHCSAVAAVALIGTAQLFPEGTINAKESIEFTTVEAPKGMQTITPKVGPIVKVADNSKQTKKIVNNQTKTKPVRTQIKTAVATKKMTAKPTLNKSSQAASPQRANVKTSNEPSPIQIKQAQELMKQKAELDALREQKEETEKALKLAEEQRAIEKEKAEALLETQMTAQAAADQELIEKQTKLAQQQKELAKLKQEMQKQAEEMRAAQVAANKAKQQSQAQSNLPYGVPSGTRNYQDLVQAPGNIPPVYPNQARLERKEGSGRLLYYVSEAGYISQVRLLQSSGYPELDNEAVTKISKYRYRSGQAGWTYHDYIFSLKGQAEATDGRLRY